MESLFLELEQKLKQQNEVLVDLVEAARHHNRALRDTDQPQMLRWVKEQQGMTDRLKQLDAEREALQQEIGQRLNIQPPVNLSSLKGVLPDTESGKNILRLTEEL